MRPGVELTPEELERALSLRPKVPLTATEQLGLLEMLAWYEERKEELVRARERREAWQKRFPVIFTAVSALIGVLTLGYNILVRK